MKHIFLYCVIATSVVFGHDLNSAIRKIPEILEDQSKTLNILYDLPKSNQTEFASIAENAILKYPMPDNEKTNAVSQFKKYCFMATNDNPTTILKSDWNMQLRFENQMGLSETRVQSKSSDLMDGHSNEKEIATIPDEFGIVPKAYLNRNVPGRMKNYGKDEPGPYVGQGF